MEGDKSACCDLDHSLNEGSIYCRSQSKFNFIFFIALMLFFNRRHTHLYVELSGLQQHIAEMNNLS